MLNICDAYLFCLAGEWVSERAGDGMCALVDEIVCWFNWRWQRAFDVHICACYSVSDAVLNYMWITLFETVYGPRQPLIFAISLWAVLLLLLISSDFIWAEFWVRDALQFGFWTLRFENDVDWNAFNGFPSRCRYIISLSFWFRFFLIFFFKYTFFFFFYIVFLFQWTILNFFFVGSTLHPQIKFHYYSFYSLVWLSWGGCACLLMDFLLICCVHIVRCAVRYDAMDCVWLKCCFHWVKQKL